MYVLKANVSLLQFILYIYIYIPHNDVAILYIITGITVDISSQPKVSCRIIVDDKLVYKYDCLLIDNCIPISKSVLIELSNTVFYLINSPQLTYDH